MLVRHFKTKICLFPVKIVKRNIFKSSGIGSRLTTGVNLKYFLKILCVSGLIGPMERTAHFEYLRNMSGRITFWI